MVLLARTKSLSELTSTTLTRGLSLFYVDLANGKRKGQVTVQGINKMGGRAIDANQVLGFLSTNLGPTKLRLRCFLTTSRFKVVI